VSDPAPDPGGAILARVVAVLQNHRVSECAFTGGVAVGVWARPRQTHDIDVCGVLPVDEVDRLLALRDGLRSGAEALPDLVRFRVGDWDVDLFVCKDEYDRTCLARAVASEVDGQMVRVVTAEDLLIHKMIELRSDRRRLLQDLADIRSVVEAQGTSLEWSHVRAWLPKEEAEVLESVATIDDETLARTFLSR
jgi:hypothetical protein